MRREKKTECNHIPISARRDERGTCWPFLPAFPYSTLITVHFTHSVLSLSDATRSFFCLPLLVGSVPPSPSPDKSNNRRVCVSPQSRRRLLEKRNIEFPRALMYGRRDLCPFHSAGATGSFALWAIVWLCFRHPFLIFRFFTCTSHIPSVASLWFVLAAFYPPGSADVLLWFIALVIEVETSWNWEDGHLLLNGATVIPGDSGSWREIVKGELRQFWH